MALASASSTSSGVTEWRHVITPVVSGSSSCTLVRQGGHGQHHEKPGGPSAISAFLRHGIAPLRLPAEHFVPHRRTASG
jgi:hypothetical protein